jgi:hypothetical protein
MLPPPPGSPFPRGYLTPPVRMHDLLSVLPSTASLGYSIIYLLIGATVVFLVAKAPGG